MTNYSETSLYIGVTSNLQKRVLEHKNKVVEDFTKKYNVDKLVYYELTDSIESALYKSCSRMRIFSKIDKYYGC